jgi:hypothetical protein
MGVRVPGMHRQTKQIIPVFHERCHAMDVGYIILFSLILVYGAAGVFLFLRARESGTRAEEK